MSAPTPSAGDPAPERDPARGAPQSPDTLRVDVVSDVVCPWCFIGKRQLEQALQRWMHAHPGAEAPRVYWHPFQLNPDIPPQGMSRTDYMEMKFGSADPRRYDNVRRAAEAVELPLALDKISRQPNTLRAHALIEASTEDDRQQKLVEALFDAYFLQGRDLTDPQQLVAVGVEAGLDEARARGAIEDDQLATHIAERDAQAREMGIRGVPFFIFDRKVAVSGAQGADSLYAAMEKAREAA